MSDNSTANFINSIHAPEDVLVFDLGFGEIGIRHLEYLCRIAVTRFSNKLLIFWNIGTDWSQFGALSSWMADNVSDNQPAPLFVRGFGDARAFLSPASGEGFRPIWGKGPFAWYVGVIGNVATQARSGQISVGHLISLSLDDYISIALRVNTAYLTEGFRGQDTVSGFFRGKIHLLSTMTATRYFALSSNMLVGVGANLNRWVWGSAAGISKVLGTTYRASRPPVILAFAGRMSDLLAQLLPLLPKKTRAYTILTFNVPTREEISSYIHEEDEVILLTDVVRTGSLLSARI